MKTVLFGGSFDPPHYGHLHLIRLLTEQSDYQRVIIVPLNVPSHKRVERSTDAAHRVGMLRRLLSSYDLPAVIDTCEIDRGGVSHTYDTVLDLVSRYTDMDGRIGIVIGDDLLGELDRWYMVDQLKGLADFVVIFRGEKPAQVRRKIEELAASGFSIQLVEGSRVEVSSSEIRQRLQNGSDVSDMLPEDVIRYIEEHGLYSGA
jgi:nicotinate-nucleotide adenylyltransferase